jgi:hypothetical protein
VAQAVDGHLNDFSFRSSVNRHRTEVTADGQDEDFFL